MKASRIALFTFATAVALATLTGSYSSASAGGFASQYAWMGNEPYVACLKLVGAFRADYPGRDKNIDNCKRTYRP